MDRYMDRYIDRATGAEMVYAEPETRDGRDGYLVLYNYPSWFPKETFERSYRRLSDARPRPVDAECTCGCSGLQGL